MILLPQNSAAWLYLGFFGYYPILKEKFERKSKLVSWILKEITANVAMVLLLLGEKFILAPETKDTPLMYAVFILLVEIAFPIYDIALTRMITLYLRKLRSKFRIK